ncbi:hypothetical protein CBL_05452 [Carabus blaptoides fortunei]
MEVSVCVWVREVIATNSEDARMVCKLFNGEGNARIGSFSFTAVLKTYCDHKPERKGLSRCGDRVSPLRAPFVTLALPTERGGACAYVSEINRDWLLDIKVERVPRPQHERNAAPRLKGRPVSPACPSDRTSVGDCSNVLVDALSKRTIEQPIHLNGAVWEWVDTGAPTVWKGQTILELDEKLPLVGEYKIRNSSLSLGGEGLRETLVLVVDGRVVKWFGPALLLCGLGCNVVRAHACDRGILPKKEREGCSKIVRVREKEVVDSWMDEGPDRKIYPKQTNMIKQRRREGTNLTHDS